MRGRVTDTMSATFTTVSGRSNVTKRYPAALRQAAPLIIDGLVGMLPRRKETTAA